MIKFLPIRAAKELRELFPWWAATVVGMIACSALSRIFPQSMGRGPFSAAAVMIYVAGSVALGALSIGHEYSNRTLGALLAQPINRRRILATKMAVLVPLSVVLIPIARFLFLRIDGHSQPASTWPYWGLVALPVIAGLCLAPWLTMACRGALAGTIFAMALPLLLFVISVFSGVGEYWFVAGMAFLSVLATLMTWRGFMRLEAIEGPQAEIDVPGWIRRQSIGAPAPTVARNRVWLLVNKELRIQQMTLVVSALFVACWVGVLALPRFALDYSGPDLGMLSVLHGVFIVVVAGALASAEERHLGTIAWQALMPMAAWRQWAIKTGVAMTLGFALAVGLPLLLDSIGSNVDHLHFDWELLLPVSILSASALYVSSLNSSGMRAILATFPAGAGATLISGIVIAIGEMAAREFRPLAAKLTPFAFNSYGEFRHWSNVMSVATLTPLAVGLVWLILAFGLANHRSADRPASRVRQQIGWIVLYVLTARILGAIVSELLRAGIQR